MYFAIKSKPINLGLQNIVATPIIGEPYMVGTMIQYNGTLWVCKTYHKYETFVQDNWDPVVSNASGGVDGKVYEYLGVKDTIADLPTTEKDGAICYVIEDKNTYIFKTDKWEKAGELVVIDEYAGGVDILAQAKEYTDSKVNKNVYDSSKTYSKYEEVILVPTTYDEVTYNANTNYVTQIGHTVRYNMETKAKRYDVKYRAKVDSPRALPTYTADWEPVDPMAVIETGSNNNGSYVLHAGGDVVGHMLVYVSSENKVSWTQKQGKPIYCVANKISLATFNSGSLTDFVITSVDVTGYDVTVKAIANNNTAQNWSGIVRIHTTDTWHW